MSDGTYILFVADICCARFWGISPKSQFNCTKDQYQKFCGNQTTNFVVDICSKPDHDRPTFPIHKQTKELRIAALKKRMATYPCPNCDERITEVLRKVDNIETTLKDIKIMMSELSTQLNRNSHHTRGETTVPILDKKRRKKSHFPECTVKDYVHKDVLQEKYQKIVNTLDFSKNNVLDKLIQSEAISDSDHEIVLNLICKRKDQNRYLIHRFRRYGTDKFKTFLESLKEDYSDLASDLSVSFEEKLKESNKGKCVHCTIAHTVDISDVLDSLFENKIIDDEIIDQKFNGRPAFTLWNQLFFQLKISPFSKQMCQGVFVDSLKVKYRDIADAVKAIEFDRIFSCSCKLQSRGRMSIASDFQTDGSGSLSDVSSLSTVCGQEDLQWPVTSPSKETIPRDKNNSLVSRSDDIESHDLENSVYCNLSEEFLFNSRNKRTGEIQRILKREPARRHTVEVTENISEFQDENVKEYDIWKAKPSRAKDSSEFDALKRKLKSIPTINSVASASKSSSAKKVPQGTYTRINSERYQLSLKMGVDKRGKTDAITENLSFLDYEQNSFGDSQLPPDLRLKEPDERRKYYIHRRSPRFKTA